MFFYNSDSDDIQSMESNSDVVSVKTDYKKRSITNDNMEEKTITCSKKDEI